MQQLITILKYRSFIGEHLGPFIFADEVERKIEAALAPIIQEVIKSISFTTEDGRLSVKAESAFHAAIFLRTLQISSLFSQEVTENPPFTSPLLFRGMRDSSWEIQSSLSRYEGERDKGLRVSRLFAALMRRLGIHMIETDLSLGCYLAVSQHYGLPTDLIDFTPDPEVATFFATTAGCGTEAVIYFAPIRNLIEQGVRVYLPPPLFERILIQRGVFIESQGILPKEIFHSITFPADSSFPVFRRGYPVNILKSPLWIKHAIGFIDSMKDQPNLTEDSDLYQAWYESDAKFHLSEHGPRFAAAVELPKWLDFYEELRYWLACTMMGEKEVFWKDILEHIEQSNVELVQMHRQLIAAMGKPY